MWTPEYKYSWRKMEVHGSKEQSWIVKSGLCPATRIKSRPVLVMVAKDAVGLTEVHVRSCAVWACLVVMRRWRTWLGLPLALAACVVPSQLHRSPPMTTTRFYSHFDHLSPGQPTHSPTIAVLSQHSSRQVPPSLNSPHPLLPLTPGCHHSTPK